LGRDVPLLKVFRLRNFIITNDHLKIMSRRLWENFWRTQKDISRLGNVLKCFYGTWCPFVSKWFALVIDFFWNITNGHLKLISRRFWKGLYRIWHGAEKSENAKNTFWNVTLLRSRVVCLTIKFLKTTNGHLKIMPRKFWKGLKRTSHDEQRLSVVVKILLET
jgi:hypothetical protein